MDRAIAKVKVKDSNDEGKAVLVQLKDKEGSSVRKAKEASNAPAKADHNVLHKGKPVNNVQHKGKGGNNVLRAKAKAATVQHKGTNSVPAAKAATVRHREINNSAPAREAIDRHKARTVQAAAVDVHRRKASTKGGEDTVRLHSRKWNSRCRKKSRFMSL
ncbi:lytr family transcriptional regulator [Bacillus sp. OxB-1]|nr:lytr family transcriptional regulator [Bacillus sp. OxB-1]